MKLKTFARRAAAAGAVLAALMLAALPALAAPKVQVSTTNAVADHADILSDETEQYVNDVSIKLSDACGADRTGIRARKSSIARWMSIVPVPSL